MTAALRMTRRCSSPAAGMDMALARRCGAPRLATMSARTWRIGARIRATAPLPAPYTDRWAPVRARARLWCGPLGLAGLIEAGGDGLMLSTELTRGWGLRHPIVLAPMAGVGGGELAGVVSR